MERVLLYAFFIFVHLMTIKVLFVCLGNICRSPMAEAVFQNMVDGAGLGDKIAVDSAGTGSWHVGESAHSGTRRVLANHGIDYKGHARVVRQDEISNPATYVVAMDANNMRDLRRRFGDIGYHFAIDRNGRVWEARSLAYAGAHVQVVLQGDCGGGMGTDHQCLGRAQFLEKGLRKLEPIRYLGALPGKHLGVGSNGTDRCL